jgi:hypothetical protein
MLFATIAFSIDSMLPALPQIARELTPDNVNAAQLIITSFVLGMGVECFNDTIARMAPLLRSDGQPTSSATARRC